MPEPDLQAYRDHGEEPEGPLRTRSFPLALGLLEREGEIPDGAVRPLRELDRHLSLCEAYQIFESYEEAARIMGYR